ncbi:MAG TPA: hypothetical protein VFJ83_15245 [Nocardioidaceae bacterium]|nr:hypothetical protein [Nocardioidaceae bacterium]
MIAAFSVVLAARTNMPAADYARAACGELSILLDGEPPNEREIAETLAHAAAKAGRAATVDKAFVALEEDLDRLDAAVAKPDGLTEPEETAANDSMASLAEACADSDAPEGQSTDLGALTIQELRRD